MNFVKGTHDSTIANETARDAKNMTDEIFFIRDNINKFSWVKNMKNFLVFN